MSQPERLNPADGFRFDDTFNGDVDDILDMAVAEMGKRLRDDPESVPSHVLIKLAEQANKAAERRAALAERDQANAAQKDEVELIVATQLPSERKRDLLEQALARLEKRVAELKQLIKEGGF